MTEPHKIFALVDAPPNDGLNLDGDPDKIEQHELWIRLIASQIRAALAAVESVRNTDALPNTRIGFGCGIADQFYAFLRTFCTPLSARQVCDHLMRLAMDGTERESRKREKEAGL